MTERIAHRCVPRGRWCRLGSLFFAALLLAGATSAAAQGITPSGAPATDDTTGQADRNKSGTHDGTAPPAAETSKKQSPAVDLSAVYTGEVWSNRRGGLRRGARYLDNLDVTLTIDAERALGWRGAKLFVFGLYNNGVAFSRDVVGDAQTISNIETGIRAARLYEAWVEQRFARDRASIRFGLYDLNSEFDTTEAGSLSLLSSHGIGPEFGQSGRNGPSIFPSTSLALRADYKVSDHWLVRAAVLDGVPGDPAHPGRTAIKLSGSDGALLVGEVDYQDDDTKAGIGYWRYTARFEGLDAPEGRDAVNRRADNQGLYLLAERRLIRVPGRAEGPNKRGLAGFVRLGFAQARINPIGHFVGGGLVYTGLIRAQGDDRLGVTFAVAGFGAPYRNAAAATGRRSDRSERVVELTYRTPLSPWLTVQPDLQYIVNPGGDPKLKNALALGLRAEIGF